jgi:four helix bundle protein
MGGSNETLQAAKGLGKSASSRLGDLQSDGKLPSRELYGLTSQMRRCSVSIASNIAEGCGRRGNAEFHRFLQMAMGSASELDYQLVLARDLNYLADSEYRQCFSVLLEVQRMLSSLLQKVASERAVS